MIWSKEWKAQQIYTKQITTTVVFHRCGFANVARARMLAGVNICSEDGSLMRAIRSLCSARGQHKSAVPVIAGY